MYGYIFTGCLQSFGKDIVHLEDGKLHSNMHGRETQSAKKEIHKQVERIYLLIFVLQKCLSNAGEC